MNAFYIPRTKGGLIAELVKVYPGDKVRFRQKTYRQLLPIFISLRKEQMK